MSHPTKFSTPPLRSSVDNVVGTPEGPTRP
jgi:hypothetical protein